MERDETDLAEVVDFADAPGAALALPSHPPDPPTPGFPWIAAIAPVGGAVVLWAITGSALSLAFAALGPVVAVASVLDARRQGRRMRRKGAAERAERLAALRASVAAAHELERTAAWRRVAPARPILDARRPLDWRDGDAGQLVLGRGTRRSALRVDGTAVDADDRELLAHAARLDGAPVLAAAEGGIGVIGEPALARSAARALLVQVAHRCRPGTVAIAVPPGVDWAWATELPHRRGPTVVRLVDATLGLDETLGLDVTLGQVDRGAAPHDAIVIAVAETADGLPIGLETVVMVASPGRAIVRRRGDGHGGRTIVPALASLAEAGALAKRLATAGDREGVGPAAALPDAVPYDALDQPKARPGSRDTLPAAVGVVADGPLVLDLATLGPHAIVAGTTGSGKSEFLLAWIVALADGHPPDRVSFLLVDFKGGAAFEPVRALPHVAGIVTDLEEGEAERAVLSLRAELRHREAVLRDERVRAISELAPHVELPRLVLVVDEFQAMIERFPELGGVVADVAARGRSLGMHLVLASQRPNGVVREQVTANCAIRVSLRVMHPSDSIAVVGSDGAASIGSDTPGRGVVDAGDGRPVLFQSARVDPSAIDRLVRRTAGLRTARRPWVGPLPDRIPPDDLGLTAPSSPGGVGSLAFGLLDDPDRQRHELAVWDPGADGHLLVVGAPGSGRSSALAAVASAAAGPAAGPVVRIDGPASAQWDAMCAAVDAMRRGDGRGVIAIDDLDTRFRDWPDDHRQAAQGMVEALLREGRGRGVAVVATAASAHRLGSAIRELFGSTVVLRHPSRSDLVQAGGVGALWRADDPPGRGQWRGRRIQFVDVQPAPATDAGVVDAANPDPPAGGSSAGGAGAWAIVTASPRTDAAALRSEGHDPIVLDALVDPTARAAIVLRTPTATGPRVVIGDADAWMANWALAAAMREEAAIVVHGGLREYRVLVRDGSLPPLLDDPAAQCWVLPPGATPRRSPWPPRANN